MLYNSRILPLCKLFKKLPRDAINELSKLIFTNSSVIGCNQLDCFSSTFQIIPIGDRAMDAEAIGVRADFDEFRKQQCTAIGVPPPELRMDQHSDRRLPDVIGALCPSLEWLVRLVTRMHERCPESGRDRLQ